MLKICQKCGAQNDVNDDPAAACPSCGVIYAKVDQMITGQRQAIRASTHRKQPQSVESTSTAPARGGRVMWLICLAGSVIGVGYGAITLTYATSSPQEAAGMAIAMAFAVIPYVLARAIQELSR